MANYFSKDIKQLARVKANILFNLINNDKSMLEVQSFDEFMVKVKNKINNMEETELKDELKDELEIPIHSKIQSKILALLYNKKHGKDIVQYSAKDLNRYVNLFLGSLYEKESCTVPGQQGAKTIVHGTFNQLMWTIVVLELHEFNRPFELLLE